VVCFYEQNRVVIRDVETGEQKEVEVRWPMKCAVSLNYVAVSTNGAGLFLFTLDGDLVYVVPDSINGYSVAFHPLDTDILVIGCDQGSLRIWNVRTQAYVSTFKQHANCITSIRFAPDHRMFLSSWDMTASITTLNDRFQIESLVKLEGDTDWVTDILPLPFSNKCITCSDAKTIKVWDCQTCECISTLTEHTDWVTRLALHPSKPSFASGSLDKSVIIWSSKTFEVLCRLNFAEMVQSLIFAEGGSLLVGVFGHGVVSCTTLTGEVGPTLIPSETSVFGLALGMM
jgi:WD40 repeat protein